MISFGGNGGGASSKSVFITGGTGTFGKAFARHALRAGYSRVCIYSRDEQKQEDVHRELSAADRNNAMRLFIGDVRDESRLKMAMRGCTHVVHAAALKIVPKCEYDPIEAIRTNVDGSSNVVKAAIELGVSKVVALSTDKAVAPVNLYGATKLCAEKLFIAANALGADVTKFAVVRYGNVAGSRGSVIPLFKKLADTCQELPVTHVDMTRFWITIDQAVDLVVKAFQHMDGGEVFIPKMPSFKIMDLVKAFDRPYKIVGVRPGEKIHETLIADHDLGSIDTTKGCYILLPDWKKPAKEMGQVINYSSGANTEWLPMDDLMRAIR